MTSRDHAENGELMWSTVEYYVQSGLDTTFRMNGVGGPRIDYVVLNKDIELRVELSAGQHAPTSKHPMILVEEVTVEGTRTARLRTADPTLQRDFHDMITAVAERMATRGQSLEQALAETLRKWNALLREPRSLLQSRQIGLLGELAVLSALADDEQVGWATAVGAWVGPTDEEHDFALADYDVEVKTTSATRSVHAIHGLGQLTPKQGRPLWLVSIQVTRGGNAGITLCDMIEIVREKLTSHAPHRVTDLDDLLADASLDSRNADEERWVLASAPRVFSVRNDFPRLDESLLAGLSPTNRSRIDQIGYRVDLTGLTPDADSPTPLTQIRFPTQRK